jgi:NAD(P)-dependent dehydrogenase (short-subunit alcohol dehydrogenase family)
MSSKKIIILGGSGAIGSSIAKELKKKKYEPILISKNKEDLELIAKKIDCEYYVCDILDTQKLDDTIKEIGENIFGLAYCIGSINLKPLKLSKESDFLESYKINTLGAINSIKAAQESLLKNNGSILLFSTVAVKQGFINHSIISTAKGAIEGLTLSLAAEFAPKIRVNCIAPSLTDAKMSRNMIKNENIRKAIEGMHPIPKIGEGSDFAELGSYLLSENNKWITGQILHIDGGRSTLRIKA